MLGLLGQALPITLASIFLWSGAAKLGSPTGAGDAIAHLSKLPPSAGRLAARQLALLEIAAAVSVATSIQWAFGYSLSLFLGVMIVLASLWGILSHKAIPCGCFGTRSSRPIGWRTLSWGALISAASAVLLAGYPHVQYTLEPLARVAAVCCVATMGALLKHVDLLSKPIANFTFRGAA